MIFVAEEKKLGKIPENVGLEKKEDKVFQESIRGFFNYSWTKMRTWSENHGAAKAVHWKTLDT